MRLYLVGLASFDYDPEQAFSLGSNYYSIKDGKIWQHYSLTANRNNLYSTQYDSYVEFIFNPNPSTSKVFKTVNYEGSNGWEVSIPNPEYDPTDPNSPEKIGGFIASRSFELNDTAKPLY